MTDTETTQQRLMRERARALATLLLTAHPDVHVGDVSDDIGIDLVARLTTGGGCDNSGSSCDTPSPQSRPAMRTWC